MKRMLMSGMSLGVIQALLVVYLVGLNGPDLEAQGAFASSHIWAEGEQV